MPPQFRIDRATCSVLTTTRLSIAKAWQETRWCTIPTIQRSPSGNSAFPEFGRVVVQSLPIMQSALRFEKDRDQKNGDNVHHFDHGVHSGTGGILVGIAHGIAGDGSLVGL